MKTETGLLPPRGCQHTGGEHLIKAFCVLWLEHHDVSDTDKLSPTTTIRRSWTPYLTHRIELEWGTKAASTSQDPMLRSPAIPRCL